MISSAYCWVNNRFININVVVKTLKYQTIIDWSSAIGMTTSSCLTWFENKEKIIVEAFIDK